MNISVIKNKKCARRGRSGAVLAALCLLGFALENTAGAVTHGETAFPGAIGFGVDTPGGRGGRVIKVTNLDAAGPGSFAEAVQTAGARVVVFEVGGVIDLDGTVLKISQPFLTIAGQTAPSPGISIIRGGVSISTHDVVVRHLRVRIGDLDGTGRKGWEPDAMATTSGWNVVVDHCSFAWAIDENLSASGPRFDGETVADWRKNTSHDITFSHCIVAEGLSHSSHARGEHSKGTLIHDNTRRIAVIGNLYASNAERNPLFKGGTQGIVVNNLIDNPKAKAMHYNLMAHEWTTHPYVDGEMAVVGNVLQYGPDTADNCPVLIVRGDGRLNLYIDDNLVFNRAGRAETPTYAVLFQAQKPANTVGVTRLDAAPVWPAGFHAIPAAEVRERVLKDAGARPWDRDVVDRRIIGQVTEHRGRIIDSQTQVGGYPHEAMTTRKLAVPAGDIEAWLAEFAAGPK